MKRFSLSQWFECLRSRPKATRRGPALRRQFVEALEDRLLLAAAPTTTLDMNLDLPGDQTSHQVLVGEDTRFSVTLDNTGNALGYGPFVDLIVNYAGADGVPQFPSSFFSPGSPPAFVTPFTGNPDGLGVDTNGAAIGQLITATVYDLPLVLKFVQFDATGHATHPFAKDNVGNPVIVAGPAGNVLVAGRLPFGSFADDQPPAPVLFTAHVSSLADVGVALAVQARGGFEFGTTPLDDAALGDLSLLESGGFQQGSVTPQVMILTKSNSAPESETATGPNFARQWQIDVNVAAGQTINNLVVTDLLPATAVFLGLGNVSVSQPATKAFSGNSLQVSFTNPLTGAVGNDANISFSFYVPELVGSTPVLDPATGAPSASINTVTSAGNWVPTDTRDHASFPGSGLAIAVTGGPATNTLQDKSIAIQKSMAIVNDVGAAGPTPLDILEYTLAFQISDFFGFQDIVVDDFYSDGQLLNGTPTLVITTNGSTTTVPLNFVLNTNYTNSFTPDGNPATHDSRHLHFDVSALMTTNLGTGQLLGGLFTPTGSNDGPTTGTIRFRTQIQESYQEFQLGITPSLDEHDELFNSVIITGALLDGSRSATTATQTDDSNVLFTVPVGTLTKTIYAINGIVLSPSVPPGLPPHVAPGDTVTYRLQYNLTTGDFEDFHLTDFLPHPKFLADDADAIGGAGPNWTLVSGLPLPGQYSTSGSVPAPIALTVDPTSNSLEWDFGTRVDLNNAPDTIDILFTVTATNVPFANGLFLTNQGVSSQQDTHLHQLGTTSLVQIISAEPHLLISKGVIATDNDNPGHGVFAPVLPSSAFSDPGTAGFRYTGSAAITSANLPSLINTNLSNVDASDLVTFAIAVENIGSDPQGAFDVTVQDTIPLGFRIPAGGLNLTVTDGTGAVLSWTGNLFGAGLELTDPNATTGALDNFNPLIPGKNILFITYDLEADSLPASPAGPSHPVVACETITNTATLLAYASLDGGAVMPGLNFVPDHLTDTATVEIACPAVTKALITTGIGPFGNTQAVIGETVTYIIRLTVPEGITPNVSLDEILPPGMAYVSSFMFGALPSDVTITGSITPIASGSGVSFPIGTVTNVNTNNNQPEVLQFSLTMLVLDVASNQDGTQLFNQAAVSVDGDQHSLVSAGPVTVIEPVLQVNKSVDQPSGVDGGDTVTFSITVSNSSPSSTDANDVVLTDVLPAGFVYVANTLTFTGTAAAPTASGVSGGVITATWASIPLNTFGILTFQATLDHTVIPCQELTNTADVTWTSLPGSPSLLLGGNLDATERNGTGGSKPYNDYFATGSATVMVDCLVLEKSLVTTSEASTTGNHVAIGEIVRYRLLTSIPEGTSPSLQIIDDLPTGMMFLNDGTAKASLVSNTGFTSGLIGANATLMSSPLTYVLLDAEVSASSTLNDDNYGDGTDVYFKFGTLVNNDSDPSLEFVVIEFNAVVLNTLGNQAGVSLMNCYTATIQPCVDFTLGVDDAFAPANVETTAPSPGLQQKLMNLGVLAANVKGYDNSTPNNYFADSFTGLPSGIVGAELRIRLKPHAGNSENDSLTLAVYDATGNPIVVSGAGNISQYGTFLGSGNGSPGVLSNVWDSNNYPGGTLLTLDLANLPNGMSLLAALNAGGQLDVYTQDDTAVDFIELCVMSPPTQVGEESNCVTVFVVEPELINTGKEYISHTAADGTFSVDYEVSFSNAAGPFSSTAFDIHIDDVLSPFFILDTAHLVVKRNGLYTLVNGVDMNNVSTSNHVDLTINQLAPGDTIQLFYTVFVTPTIQPCQHITNTANVTYTSLPGEFGTQDNPTGSTTPETSGKFSGERDGHGAPLNDYFDSSVATITADCPEISKTIVNTSSSLTGTAQYNPFVTDVSTTETVTYQVTFTLPVGTTSPAILTDNLPTGLAGVMLYVSSTIVSIGSGISTGPTVVPVVSDTNGDSINDQVVYNFGTRTVVAGPLATRQITVQVVGQVTTAAVNVLGKVLTNTASLYYGLGTMAAAVDAEVAKGRVNVPPTDLTLSATTIAENNLINAMVGTLTGTDPDIGDTLTYTLVAGVGDTDNINFSVIGTTLMVTPRTDFETKNSYSIRAQVADQEGMTFEKQFTITVINLMESFQLSLGEPGVNWASGQQPVVVLPMLTVSGGPALPGCILTVNINAVGSAKKMLDSIRTLGFANLGTSTGPQYANGRFSIQIQLAGTTTAASIQSFLRGITFATQGKGLKTPTRMVEVAISTPSMGTTSVSQTINVRTRAAGPKAHR